MGPSESPSRERRMSHTGSVSRTTSSKTMLRASQGGITAGKDVLSSPSHSSPGNVPSGTSPSGTQSLHTSGDIPRLPAVTEGEKVARSLTSLSSMNLRRSAQSLAGTSSSRDMSRSVAAADADSVATLKKERTTLANDKAALLLNKRRLETVLGKVLEVWDDESSSPNPYNNGNTSQSGGMRMPPTGALRAQLLKTLDESTGLEKQLVAGVPPVPAAPTPSGGKKAADAEARAWELTLKIAEMQAEHDLVVSRLEGELTYRRTQATAATAGLQKQVAEMEEDLMDARRRLDASEHRMRDVQKQNEELRRSQEELRNALSEKASKLQSATELLGKDKVTIGTVNEMLRDQLMDAKAELEAKIKRVTELEYAVVHRDALLAEAHMKLSEAASAAKAAAATGTGPAAVAAAVAKVASSHHDAKMAWTGVAKTVKSRRSSLVLEPSHNGHASIRYHPGEDHYGSDFEADD